MKYRIKEDVLWKIADGEAVIVNPANEKYSYLNSTGTEIWKMIDKNYSVHDIEEELTDIFDIPEAELKQDVSDIIDELKKQDLIEQI
ncbi:MAG: PqqD family protein [Elusimicrobiota bacterium]